MAIFLSLMLASLLLGSASLALPPNHLQVPAMFVFGDSLVDPGNNNGLLTLARADYNPNGIDFAAGATGRFCNGGTVADHLGNLLGLPLIPPFNNPETHGPKILQGVNFASGGAGILDDSGKIYGDRITMDQQIKNFEETIQEVSKMLGNGTREFLARSLFFVCLGSNDHISNYLLPFSDKPKKYTAEAFNRILVNQYMQQLKGLHKLGARKFLIGGLPPLGCIPQQIANLGGTTSTCVEGSNILATEFNTILKLALDEANSNLQGSDFLYWDTYSFTYDIILVDSSRYGFEYTNRACCGWGRSGGQIICLPELPLECQNRSEYVFWDPYHPTDAFNAIAAKHAYAGIILQNTVP